MPLPPEVFRHHPNLRGMIADPEASSWRTFHPSIIDPLALEQGYGPEWRYTDDHREGLRQQVLGGRLDRDLWVFGYGSLMWDPGFVFAEVRRGRLEGYARRMCLKDTIGARGTRDAPGLMAGLDRGPEGCDGLVFRIAAEAVEVESEVLWRREMLGEAYLAVFVEVDTAEGPVEALTFVADHDCADIDVTLGHAEMVAMVRTSRGMLGTSLQYLENVVAHLRAFGIVDEGLEALLADARAG